MKINKTYEIDLGEFSTEHSVFIVYDDYKYMPSEDDAYYIIKEYTPKEVLSSLEHTIVFMPFIELYNEHTDTMDPQFIDIHNKDPEYKIFQTKEEAENYIESLDKRDSAIKKKEAIKDIKQNLVTLLDKYKTKNSKKELIEKVTKLIETEF